MADRVLRAIITGSSAGAVRAFEETALAAEKTGSRLGTTIEAGSKQAGNALTRLGQTAGSFGLPFANSLTMVGEKFDSTASKGAKFGTAISQLGKVSLVAGVAGLVAFGGEAVKLGSTLDDAQAQLGAAITATGQSMTKWQGPIAATQRTMENLGFTVAQTDSALSHSVVSTQDVGKSLGTMGLAADLARLKHEDLTNATDALDKALTGNLRPLRQMGIDLPITASSALKLQTANENLTKAQGDLQAILAAVPGAADASSAAHGRYEAALIKVDLAQQKVNDQSTASQQIMDALSQRLGGQAAAAAETFRGKVDVLKAQLSDMGAQIGQFLIPKLESVIGFLSRNKGAVEALAIAVGAVLGAAITVFAVETVSKFVRGIGSMVAAIEGLVLKWSAASAGIELESGAMAASVGGIGASFTALLGPIGMAAAALTLFYSISKPVKLSSTDTATAQTSSSILRQLNENIKSKQPYSVGYYQQALAKSKDFSPGERIVVKGGVASLTGTPAQKSAADIQSQITASEKAANAAAKEQAAQAGAGAAAAASGAAHAAAASQVSAHAKALADAAAAALKMKEETDKVKASVDTLVKDSLTKANTALKDAQTAYTNFAQATTSAVTSTFSFSDAEKAGQDTGTSFLDALANQAGTVNDFTSKVKLLLQYGLSKDAMSQVLAAGTQAGDDIATQLLNGGADAINQANTMTAAVTNAATALGTDAADEFYGAGVKQAQSIVDGITDESKRLAPKLKAASKTIAEHLKTQVEVDLRIISAGGKAVPKFAAGGVVPGPMGSPLLALVHGGETVTPPGQGTTGTVHYDFSGMTIVANDPQTLVNQLRVYMQRNGTLASAGIR